MIELEMRNNLWDELKAKYHHRSDVETYVHIGLISMGIKTAYELPTQHSTKYLPDFTWTNDFVDEQSWRTYERHLSAYVDGGGACANFQWIEAKPQDYLNVLRNECFRMANLSVRKVSDKFKGSIMCRLDSNWLWSRRNLHDIFKELAAPKKLAEESGLNVLVIGTTDGTETLSACLTLEGIVFERYHPLVNSVGWAKRLKRLDAQAEQEKAAEASRIEYERQERERAQLALEEQRRRDAELDILRPKVRMAIASQDSRWRKANLYATRCLSCGHMVEANEGYWTRHDGRGYVMHIDCVDT
jgi:hypothetical protein